MTETQQSDTKNAPIKPLSRRDQADIEFLKGMKTWDLAVHLLQEWLYGRDRRRQRLADAMLTALGPRVLSELVRDVLACTEYPELQLRALRVIRQIGGQPTPELAVWLETMSRFGPPAMRMPATLAAAELWNSAASPGSSPGPTTLNPVVPERPKFNGNVFRLDGVLTL